MSTIGAQDELSEDQLLTARQPSAELSAHESHHDGVSAVDDSHGLARYRGARSDVVLRSTSDGRLLAMKAENSVAVRLRQCFPWSQPTRHLSLRDGDDEEIALVIDPSDLAPDSRQALEDAIAAAGFVLDVTRIVSIDEEVEIRQWVVETRQGPRNFQTHLDDWPRELPMGGLLIRDVAGDLYRLADATQLDRTSRELLWAFID